MNVQLRQDLEEALSPRSQGSAHRSSGGERFTSRGSSSEAAPAAAHAAGTSPAMQRQTQPWSAGAGEGSGITGAAAPSSNAAEPERQAEARPAVPGEDSRAVSMAKPAAKASLLELERPADGESAELCENAGIRGAAPATPADRESPSEPERQANGEPAVSGNSLGSRGAGPAAPANQARLLEPRCQANNQPAMLGVGVRVGDAARAAPADPARQLEPERQADGQSAGVSEAEERSADAVPPRAAKCTPQGGEGFADPLGVRGSGETREASRLGLERRSTSSAGVAAAAAVPVGGKPADEARAALWPDDGQGATEPAAGSPITGSPASPFLDVHARAGDAGHVSPPDAGHLPTEISQREVRRLQAATWLDGVDGNGGYDKP